ncbi:hypothetical protein POTOM_044902 [Populus tomentosa]|uniref:Di19 zinc-binding domain-containing protein n=1 Tax=Populus tomentosa TaxID=118781 RepID=A0A8X8CCL5_POPTO|nr:hypothetical protein POTOM_044902 [Populus tomentosa]
MDADSWSGRLSSASKRYQSALQSRSVETQRFLLFDKEKEKKIVSLCENLVFVYGVNGYEGSSVVVEIELNLTIIKWRLSVSKCNKLRKFSLKLQIIVIMFANADMFMGFEEIDGDDDIREEFPCPFCSEYFDIVGLCCHIDDEHPVESKNGVCPVCAMRVGVDMVAHITLQHGNIFKISFSIELSLA